MEVPNSFRLYPQHWTVRPISLDIHDFGHRSPSSTAFTGATRADQFAVIDYCEPGSRRWVLYDLQRCV
ncbi:hypothetical protein L914_11148 [Phytophthora nicotianae]|uniref:Uncharacterized protein n=1 Tax=Phytophthora nicotianae TaxID=4792 RepID=W2N3V4_PHYNI|nr:hypothetical protein L914_11148 [Phytophthora nicotianae]